MVLTIGDVAPAFSLPSVDGSTQTLESYRGKRVLLSFYRYASCPLCNLRVHSIHQHATEFEDAGVQVICIFQSSIERMKEHVAKDDVSTPIIQLLADPDQEVYKLYQIGSSKLGYIRGALLGGLLCCKICWAARLGHLGGPADGDKARLPSDFLLDENGVIVDCFHAASIDQHMPWERIEAFLKNNNK